MVRRLTAEQVNQFLKTGHYIMCGRAAVPPSTLKRTVRGGPPCLQALTRRFIPRRATMASSRSCRRWVIAFRSVVL